MAQFTKAIATRRAMALAVAIAVAGGTLSAQAIRSVPRITIDELKALMDQKAVVVLDVRDARSFGKGRIPGGSRAGRK